MKQRKTMLLVSAALFMGMNSHAEYKPGELIVRFKEGSIVTPNSVKSVYRSAGVQSTQSLMGRTQKVTLKPGVDTFAAMDAMRGNPAVEAVQLNYTLWIPEKSVAFIKTAKKHPYAKQLHLFAFMNSHEDSDVQRPSDRPDIEPRPDLPDEEIPDEHAKHLWGLKVIQAREAWDKYPAEFKYNTTVAVIDTGIDYNHEDLGYNLWRQKGRDGREYVGYDFIHNDGLPYDDQGHGTHTAGTVGAIGYNGIGVLGVAPAVNIMSLKFLSAEGGGTTADAIRAIDFAVKNGARVLSNSWGGPAEDDNDALRDAIIRAEKQNVLFIAAAGNEDTSNDTGKKTNGDESEISYPAAFQLPNLISVLASDSSDKRAYFSNHGPKTTHIAAPGVNILSTKPENKYVQASGTSMACPHVAGAAAMIWSLKPKWNYKQVRDMLLESVDPVEGMDQFVSSGGRLNLANAVREATKRLRSNR